MLLLFYKSFPVIAQYLIYTSLNLTVPLIPLSFIQLIYLVRKNRMRSGKS
ncbi:hypothetical protein [Rickettsia sp. MEAM1 (Bemisia tabaci)]|nr:hypothetical protein [Rickettsia sp. MEAM1 (Bemisia tabaci)]